MSEEPKPDAPPAGEKKKKIKKAAPVCPPAISTSYMILRSVLSSLFPNETFTVGPFQPTYLKDGRPTGKFFMTCKRSGSFWEDPENYPKFWNLLQETVDSVLKDGLTFTCTSATKEAAVQALGEAILDDGLKKKHEVLVASCGKDGESVVAVPPSAPFASSSAISAIRLELGTLLSEVKIPRKSLQIILKFEVVPVEGDSPDLATGEGLPVTSGKLSLSQTDQLKTLTTPTAPETKTDENPEANQQAEEEMVVNAFEVSGKIDYTKLVNNFGSTIITDDLMKRLEANTVGKGRVPHLHRFLRRGMFFSHRDLDTLLKQVEAGKPMYLYTGRGPSSESMHLGHLIPFLFTKWLQDAFDAPLVVQMTDDEKFLFKGNYDEFEGDNLMDYKRLTMENARDIIACGFNYEKTFLFSDLDYVGSMYPNIVRIWKAVTTNTINGIFGFDGSSNIGKIAFPAIQAAPSFANSFPTVLNADRNTDRLCLIPCAIDQDPYFRMTRDIAHKLVTKKHGLGGKPALIHSKFFPPLQGAEGKMSSSNTNSAIFLTDSPEEIERKIKEHAFSGGRETKKDQEEFGADLELDVSYQWLRFFLEDDQELADIGKDYGSGSGKYWSTGAVKARLVEVLQEIVAAHQERRAKISDEEVFKWMKERCIVPSTN